MEKKKLAICIIICIILFSLGLFLGTVLQSNNKAQVVKNQAVNNLSSKIISTITAYGAVVGVADKEVEITNQGENLKIQMADNAAIYSFVVPQATSKTKTATAPVQKTISLSDIKVGDNVNIIFKLLPTGQMQGQSLVVLPVVEK